MSDMSYLGQLISRNEEEMDRVRKARNRKANVKLAKDFVSHIGKDVYAALEGCWQDDEMAAIHFLYHGHALRITDGPWPGAFTLEPDVKRPAWIKTTYGREEFLHTLAVNVP